MRLYNYMYAYGLLLFIKYNPSAESDKPHMRNYPHFIADLFMFGITHYFSEYELHEKAGAKFAPYISDSASFEADIQILRDLPGPAGLRYMAYIGHKAFGVLGLVTGLILALAPAVTIACLYYLFIEKVVPTFQLEAMYFINAALNGMIAAAAGIVFAGIAQLISNNRYGSDPEIRAAAPSDTAYLTHVRKNRIHSYIVVLISGVMYFFIASFFEQNNYVGLFFMAAALVASVILGLIKYYSDVKTIKNMRERPEMFELDKYSKKATKIRDRALREEEEEMKKR